MKAQTSVIECPVCDKAVFAGATIHALCEYVLWAPVFDSIRQFVIADLRRRIRRACSQHPLDAYWLIEGDLARLARMAGAGADR